MKHFFLLTTLILGMINFSKAQDSFQPDTHVPFGPVKSITDDEYHPKNIFKTNLMGIVFKNYSLNYERVINKWFSACLEIRTMPSTSIPFVDILARQSNELISENLKQMKLSGFGITPEVRFYPNLRGYGRGFYLGAFYRNSTYTANNFKFNYTALGEDENILLKGKLSTNTFGIEMGKQWIIGKHFVIDWIIFGAQFGTANATFDGYSTRALSSYEQSIISNALNGIEVPLVEPEKEVTVDEHNAKLKLTSPWLGLRSGFSIGFCF